MTSHCLSTNLFLFESLCYKLNLILCVVTEMAIAVTDKNAAKTIWFLVRRFDLAGQKIDFSIRFINRITTITTGLFVIAI